jgi:hypothetical protein
MESCGNWKNTFVNKLKVTKVNIKDVHKCNQGLRLS